MRHQASDGFVADFHRAARALEFICRHIVILVFTFCFLFLGPVVEYFEKKLLDIDNLYLVF
jgi:hypothetical protein